MRESEVLQTLVPRLNGKADGDPGGETVIIRLGGSRVYGRARIVEWKGKLRVEGNAIVEAKMHGLFNPEQGIQGSSEQELDFHFISSGNSLNFCLQLSDGRNGTLHFESGPHSFSLIGD